MRTFTYCKFIFIISFSSICIDFNSKKILHTLKQLQSLKYFFDVSEYKKSITIDAHKIIVVVNQMKKSDFQKLKERALNENEEREREREKMMKMRKKIMIKAKNHRGMFFSRCCANRTFQSPSTCHFSLTLSHSLFPFPIYATLCKCIRLLRRECDDDDDDDDSSDVVREQKKRSKKCETSRVKYYF